MGGVYAPPMDGTKSGATGGPSRPRPAALLALGIFALALIATSAAPPTVTDQATAEAGIDGGAMIEREVRIHLDAHGGDRLDKGALTVRLVSAGGLGPAYSDEISVGVAPLDAAPPAAGTASGTQIDIPVADCVAGCDLAYRAVFTASPTVGSGASIRFEASVTIWYKSYVAPTTSPLRVSIIGAEPVAPPLWWVYLVAIIGVAIGVAIGGRWRTRGRARFVPAGIAAIALALAAVWPIIVWGVDALLAFSAVLLLTHAVAITIGVRRAGSDGGQLQGLAGISTIVLCGLWLGWVVASFPIIQPINLAIVLGGLGLVCGVVVGQAWSSPQVMDRRSRVWAVIAVLSQGLLASGLLFVAFTAMIPAWPSARVGVEGLVPLAAVGLIWFALARWFRGSRFLMAFVNIALLAIGLVGSFLWFSFRQATGSVDGSIDPADAMVLLEVAAAFVGVVAASRRLSPRSSPDAAVDPDVPSIPV